MVFFGDSDKDIYVNKIKGKIPSLRMDDIIYYTYSIHNEAMHGGFKKRAQGTQIKQVW